MGQGVNEHNTITLIYPFVLLGEDVFGLLIRVGFVFR